MTTSQHRRFDQGVNLDRASYLLQEGELSGASNIIFDKLGVARKRGGIGPGNGTQVLTGQSIDHVGTHVNDSGVGLMYSLAPGATPAQLSVIQFPQALGPLSSLISASLYLGAANPDGGRPFMHHGFLIWPCYSTSQAGVAHVAVAGQASATTSAGTAISMTAGDPRITVSGLSNPGVGSIISVLLTSTTLYTCRVVRAISSSVLEVFPAPPVTTSSAISISCTPYYFPFMGPSSGQLAYIGGKFGMSYQGRMLLGNCTRCDPATGSRIELFPRRVWFTTVLLEGDIAAQTITNYGATFLNPNSFLNWNYFDIPGQDPLTGMAPTGFGDSVYFSQNRAFRLTGTLSSQTGTQQSVTWDGPKEIPRSVGCLTERSLQRCPLGLIFAHSSGIYITDGARVDNLTEGKIGNEWRRLVRSTPFKIYGSAVIRGNHYYISGTAGGSPFGWMYNLDTKAWGPLSGKSGAPAAWLISGATPDVTDPSITWGVKWWDQSAAPPSMTGGAFSRLDDIFTQAGGYDNDGTPVQWWLRTRTYHEETPAVNKMFRQGTVDYAAQSGFAIVRADTKLDAAQMAATTSTHLPENQQAWAVQSCTNTSPIRIGYAGALGIEDDSWVVVTGVQGCTNANGRWRVSLPFPGVSSTIDLVGSYGNGAWTGGGVVQASSARDIDLSYANGIDRGPGVEYYVSGLTADGASTSGGAFELQAVMHTWDDEDPHYE